MTTPTTWPRFNLAAGPVQVMDQTLRDAAKPVLYHYDPAFIELFARTSALLKQVFRTDYDVIIMQGEAILGLEAAAAGLLSPGDKVLNLVSGVFGKWFEDFIHTYGGETIELAVPYNNAVDPDDVRKALHANPGVKYLSVVHSETPSGTHNPVKEIGAVAREFGVLTMVDTVSGLGGELLSPEEWGMDIAIAGPQKCLGGTPGLSLMSISPAAWEALESRQPAPLRASFLSILDWKSAWLEGKRFPYTPSISEMYSLESVLQQSLDIGMERFVACHQTIAHACREGVKALGLELWPAREEIAAACVTAVRLPDGIDDAKLRGTMRHRYGVMISPGYGELLGKLFRLGHMGPAQAHPTVLAAQLAVLERSLADLGYPVQLGAGVGAAMAALEGWNDEGDGVSGRQGVRGTCPCHPDTPSPSHPNEEVRMAITAKDKVVIITGGAGEMGSSLARRLVDEGAKVVIADVADGSALAKALSKQGDAIYVKTDVTSEDSTQAMAKAAIDAYGRIDALVNNAGLFTAKPWDELTVADWRERFAVNVEGTFLATKAVVPAMTEQGRGRIINIGSDTVWMGTPGFAHYVASKGAVLAFTRAIANELGPRGITSVYVTPTLLETPGTRAAFPQGHFDYVLSHTPLGRFEKPEDVNGLIVFLVSDDAAFINGAAINIGGGISMH